MYAGATWSNKSNPNTFMTENGYKTSSKTILNIIKDEGLSAFEILRIDTFCDNIPVYEYETLFLRCINCAKSIEWFNLHNNEIKYNTKRKYNVENVGQLPEVKEKIKNSMLERHGVEYAMQSEEVKQKARHTCMINYGVEYSRQSEEVIEKLKNTNIEKYGIEWAIAAPEVQAKIKNSMIERHGVEYAMQSAEVKQKTKDTMKLHFGFDHSSSSPIVQQKYKDTMQETYGETHNSRVKFMSIIETQKTYNKTSISKLFPELKRFY